LIFGAAGPVDAARAHSLLFDLFTYAQPPAPVAVRIEAFQVNLSSEVALYLFGECDSIVQYQHSFCFVCRVVILLTRRVRGALFVPSESMKRNRCVGGNGWEILNLIFVSRSSWKIGICFLWVLGVFLQPLWLQGDIDMLLFYFGVYQCNSRVVSAKKLILTEISQSP
jgi:hypothetical protein